MSRTCSAISRRELLIAGMAAGTVPILASLCRSEAVDEEDWSIVDTNISLFHWPFRRLPLDDSASLVRKLQSLGVVEAWAGSFEGLLHRDVAGVNARLASACREHPLLLPVGTINLELPGWERDLEQCLHEHRMPGVRLHPNYHGYTLDDPRAKDLFQRAAQAGFFVQIAACMEDTRTQHPRLQTPDVDLAPLAELNRLAAGARVQILNARPQGALLDRLIAAGVCFDTARVDGTSGVPQLVSKSGADRVMLGSHAPMLIPEAALIRVHESGELEERALRQVLGETARRIRNRGGPG